MNDSWKWVDEQEARIDSERSKDYFNIVEGQNRFVLLSHCAPLAQVYNAATKKYRPAEEGDTNVSIKGLCWVWQDGVIKQAKLPYVVVKQIRALGENPDWDFNIPFTHVLTLNAKGAGTKEVEYSLTPSPKSIEIPREIVDELSKKATPEEVVEKIKGKSPQTDISEPAPDYPEEDLLAEDIPFN